MKFLKKKLFSKNDAGLTLIEVMVSMVITSLIGLGASVSSLQVLNQTTRNRDYTTASRNAMSAVYWISRDAQMAQVISDVADFPQSAISLSWVDWNNSSHNATYTLQGNSLKRSYNVDGQMTQTLVAEYINPSANMTGCTSNNGTLTLTITCSVGEGSRIIDVTRIREMTARPRL